MEINCRKATLEDLPTLKEFEQGVVIAERPFNPSIGEDIVYYDLPALIEATDATVIVATVASKIVASGYARKMAASDYLNYRHFAYLGFMYVDPAYRGKGINKLIMQQAIDWAKAAGLSVLHLDVYSENEGAIKAYKKVGFKENMVDMKLDLREG